MRWLFAALVLTFAAPASADERAAYLDLARQGWNYKLRTTMVGRDTSIPVHINGRDLAGVSICIVGERPHALTTETLTAFRALLQRGFGVPVPSRYAGPDASGCREDRQIILRLYSGHPPNRMLSNDLEWLNRKFQLGLPSGRIYTANSPALAQTFFGRRGTATHIMVKQSALDRIGPLETAFYRSILIEELFQTFTFGMDVLVFDRTARFLSKLQESPLNLHRLQWGSRNFMRALLKSNPRGLCRFDLFMLHAIARTSVDQTTDPAFIEYLDGDYDALVLLAMETAEDQQFAILFDPTCSANQ